MFGLLLRLTILAAVVFGVARGISRALRSRQRRRAEADIKRDLRAVVVGREAGVLDAADQDRLTRAIYARCRAEGIDVDDTPGSQGNHRESRDVGDIYMDRDTPDREAHHNERQV